MVRVRQLGVVNAKDRARCLKKHCDGSNVLTEGLALGL